MRRIVMTQKCLFSVITITSLCSCVGIAAQLIVSRDLFKDRHREEALKTSNYQACTETVSTRHCRAFFKKTSAGWRVLRILRPASCPRKATARRLQAAAGRPSWRQALKAHGCQVSLPFSIPMTQQSIAAE